MILSAGLTPAWQQILVFDSFCYGQVNRASEALWCSSGKVFNAGIAAHHLGGPSLTLSPIGGPPAAQIEAEFEALGVPYRWVPTAAATRVCTTILDQSTGTMTELVENGRPMSDRELERFQQAYREESANADVVVLIGSLPAGTRDSYYRELLQETTCPAVLDFRQHGLLSVLDLEPYVVKPNREELELTVGHSLEDDDDLISAMRTLNDRGAQWVVITDGPNAVWLASRDRVYRLQPPEVCKVVNPIASGDAMAATIAWAIRAGRPITDAVRLGIAASVQNIQQLLPCRIDASKLDSQWEAIPIERIA